VTLVARQSGPQTLIYSTRQQATAKHPGPGDKAVSNTDKTPCPPEAYILATSLPPSLAPQFL